MSSPACLAAVEAVEFTMHYKINTIELEFLLNQLNMSSETHGSTINQKESSDINLGFLELNELQYIMCLCTVHHIQL